MGWGGAHETSGLNTTPFSNSCQLTVDATPRGWAIDIGGQFSDLKIWARAVKAPSTLVAIGSSGASSRVERRKLVKRCLSFGRSGETLCLKFEEQTKEGTHGKKGDRYFGEFCIFCV